MQMKSTPATCALIYETRRVEFGVYFPQTNPPTQTPQTNPPTQTPQTSPHQHQKETNKTCKKHKKVTKRPSYLKLGSPRSRAVSEPRLARILQHQPRDGRRHSPTTIHRFAPQTYLPPKSLSCRKQVITEATDPPPEVHRTHGPIKPAWKCCLSGPHSMHLHKLPPSFHGPRRRIWPQKTIAVKRMLTTVLQNDLEVESKGDRDRESGSRGFIVAMAAPAVLGARGTYRQRESTSYEHSN